MYKTLGLLNLGDISRAEYDSYEQKKDEAEETQIFSYQKKRGYAAEKKQVKEQKDEAERFNVKVSELKEMKCEYYLWQLYHVDQVLHSCARMLQVFHVAFCAQEMNEHEELISKEQEHLEDTKEHEASTEAELKSAKKDQAKKTRSHASLEKVCEDRVRIQLSHTIIHVKHSHAFAADNGPK